MASPWTFLALLGVLSVADVTANCALRHTEMKANQPLLLLDNDHTDVRRLARSDLAGYVNFKTGDNITLVCPGYSNYGNYLKGGNSLPLQAVNATCSDGYNFVADGRIINLNEVYCAKEPYHNMTVWRTECGGSSTYTYKLGFVIPGFFLKMYELCLNMDIQTTLKSDHYVVSGLRNTRSGTLSPFLFTVDPVQAYDPASQTESFTVQLGSTSAAKYITPTNYFVPMQIVPNADFVFGPTQLTSYYYFNTVPVWNSVSAYWAVLDEAIRTLAYTEGDLLVVTYNSWIATLPNDEGKSVDVSLHYSPGRNKINIPKYVSKLLANEATGQLVILEVPNGEDQASFSKVQESACAEDVCAQLRWLPWRSVPAEERPIICCRADDPQLLRRLPQLQEQLQKQRASDGPAGAPLLVGSASEDFYARALALSLSLSQ